ncbi:hypothetical protein ARALYDRAFT_920867 [Arabidopsis lyrata subsp. lyrata]|uniref:TIR domain-containing protein n=1 Tax=Arabidopsis lyrata subsp. lyrata TaxID=81972 RepID=D7MW48_ARALL|nr:hypothetical protein ARALYDRAFT_920867 [Arabidopsis lyrata subsp. lyrata]
MASSSLAVKPTPTGPQVFICFRGADVRKHFISFLDPALRKANINVFIDEDEYLGSDLVNLLKRIEESEIALVIFSEEFTSSYWCLEELAKIKDCKDQGKFGDHFRDQIRNLRHQPERTQKWEDALLSIPESIGMPLAAQSDRTDKDFITSMVIKIQRLVEHMAVKGNQETEANLPGGSIVPAMKPKREANSQGGSMVLAMKPETEASHQGGFVVPARQLGIAFSYKSRCWSWSTITGPNKQVSPYLFSSEAIDIVTMKKVYWLKIVGTFKTGDLTPGTKYEVVFVVKLKDNAIGWEKPVTLKLKVIHHNGDNDRVERIENLNDYIGRNWVDILAGVFVVPPKNTPAIITFTMYETEYKKKGLVVKGVTIRPTN